MRNMTRDEIRATARDLKRQAEREATQKPEWGWPTANVQLCNELISLADMENPSAASIADLNQRYHSEICRRHGLADFGFLRSIQSLPAPRLPAASSVPRGSLIRLNFMYLPKWQRVACAIFNLVAVLTLTVLFGGRHSHRPLIVVPLFYRMVISGTAVLPVVVLCFIMTRSAREIQERRAKGQCLICGYDLRATPERRPECGTLVKAQSGGVQE